MTNVKIDNTCTLMKVTFNSDTSEYSVQLAKGSSVAETAFAMSVVIKCLIRDGVIKSSNDVTDLITKYLNEPQYSEIKGE